MKQIIVLFCCFIVSLVEPAQTEQLCSTPICKKSAQLIIESLNTSVSPVIYLKYIYFLIKFLLFSVTTFMNLHVVVGVKKRFLKMKLQSDP